MYRSLENLMDVKKDEFAFIVNEIVSGKVKSFFDGEQYIINEDDLRAKKSLYQYFTDI